LKTDDEDVKTGISIVRKALTAPLKQIAVNAGLDGAVVVDKVLSMKGAADGFDAETGTYGDLLKAGVVDPAKVVRTALENASSIAATVLLTECLVADAPEKDGHAHGPAAMPGMGGMGGMM
jgi:chaperonin GroEL